MSLALFIEVVVHVISAPRVVVVFPTLFVEDPPTNGDFLVLVLQISPLSTGAPRKQIGIPKR